ncbi:DNA-3-methyladenine glycosylase [Candidatus Bipolaricaulota bacterium]|nr:DNA-3-methyladenine glycosylase [Candidatus Bipolaricaulota bacterium]
MNVRLDRDFFERDTAAVARDLLGNFLVRINGDELLRGRIVETEAYYGEGDPPSHASSGKTSRSKIMWEKPGLAYVYLVYGIHYMFNVVCEPEGKPGAVLVRGVEPEEGIEMMVSNREGAEIRQLTNGPGKLTEAFAIDREENGLDLIKSEELWLEEGSVNGTSKVETSGRIGISRGKKEQLRYFFQDNPFVSG